MSMSHASTMLGPSLPSNDGKWWLEKSRIEHPRYLTRSFGRGIRATTSGKCLVVSAMNCAKAG
jgi:hypothetical protein